MTTKRMDSDGVTIGCTCGVRNSIELMCSTGLALEKGFENIRRRSSAFRHASVTGVSSRAEKAETQAKVVDDDLPTFLRHVNLDSSDDAAQEIKHDALTYYASYSPKDV